jgi:hypothetical protein
MYELIAFALLAQCPGGKCALASRPVQTVARVATAPVRVVAASTVHVRETVRVRQRIFRR